MRAGNLSVSASIPPLALTVALGLVSGCVSSEEAPCSILLVEGSSHDVLAPAIDLEQAASAAGCTTGGVPDRYTLVIEEVVTPLDFVARGRYGRERVQPIVEPDTLARLLQRSRDDEAVASRLRAALVGRDLSEPEDLRAPVATSRGARLVRIEIPGFDSLDELVDEILDELPASSANTAAPGDGLDLSFAIRDARWLGARAAEAVALAERHSAFRAPQGLTVRWAKFDFPPPLSPAHQAAWDASPFNEAEDGVSPFSVLLRESGARAISLPGGLVYFDSDRAWPAFLLHYVLLHELGHQHQFALGDTRPELAELARQSPVALEAHASSLAREVLRGEGASTAAIDYAIACDAVVDNADRVQAFDSLRSEQGLAPDEYLLYLAGNPEEADRFRRRLGLGMMNCIERSDPSSGDGALRFEYLERSPRGRAIVAIDNATDRAVVGYVNGWWHVGRSNQPELFTGSPPFTLRLPPRGRIVIESFSLDAGAEGMVCHAVYRETPAPVFDP